MDKKSSHINGTTQYDFTILVGRVGDLKRLHHFPRPAGSELHVMYDASRPGQDGLIPARVIMPTAITDILEPELLSLSSTQTITVVANDTPEEQEAANQHAAIAELTADFDNLPPAIQKVLLATGVVKDA